MLLNTNENTVLDGVTVNGCSLWDIYTTIVAKIVGMAMVDLIPQQLDLVALEIAIPFFYIWDGNKYRNMENISSFFNRVVQAGFDQALLTFNMQNPKSVTKFALRNFTFYH